MPLAMRISAVALVIVLAVFLTTRIVRFTKARIAGIFGRARIAKTERPSSPSPQRAQAPSINIPQDKSLSLAVRAKKDVWMQVKSDGDVVFKRVLSKNNVETWNAAGEIELWVGDASALELVLNGIPLGSPGRGVKKGILITREGIKIP